jgi:hypothetical protein
MTKRANSLVFQNLLIGLSMIGVAQAPPAVAAGDTTFAGITEVFKSQHIGEDYSEESYQALVSMLKRDIESDTEAHERVKRRLKVAEAAGNAALAETLDDEKDDLRDKIKLYSHALELLDRAKTPYELRNAFLRSKRIVYTVLAKEHVGRRTTLRENISFLSKFTSSIPYVSYEDRGRRVDKNQAELEAKNLTRPGQGRQYITPTELSSMSIAQIAALDVSDDHPAWYTEKFLQSLESDPSLSGPLKPWLKLEKWAEARVSKSLKKVDYRIEDARKILFLRAIKTTATSPKVNTRDIFGQKYKLKWGSEMQIEPVASRLYVKLGGKFTDLTYANKPGVDGSVLILEKPDRSLGGQLRLHRLLRHVPKMHA